MRVLKPLDCRRKRGSEYSTNNLMQGIITRSIMALLTVTAAVSLFTGCGAKQGPATGEGPQKVTLQSILPRDSDAGMEIVVGGSAAILQYTSFQLTEPLRLVVDITDADLGVFREKIVVNKGVVLDITPSQIENIVRLEITLAQPVDSKVIQSSGSLVIGLSQLTGEQGTTPGEVVSAATPTVQEGEATARSVNAVRATNSKDGASVVIMADGSMKPTGFMIDGKKLVIDIPGVKSKVRPSVIPVRKSGIDKIRVGQHTKPEQKVRVVVDLTKQMDYTITSEGNTMVVAFGAPVARQSEEAPKERAAQAPTEQPQAMTETETQAAPPVETETKQEAVPPPAAPSAPAVAADALDMVVGGKKYTGRRISLDLQDADLVNVLRLFGELANLNMILSPDVKGKVTVRLVNIPWDQAMEIILKINSLGFAIEDNILRIASQTALAREAEEEVRTKEAKKKAEDLITRLIPINYSDAKNIETTIKRSLSARGETVVDARTNTLIVKDISRNIEDVLELVRRLDKPTPQIMIEARIIEASLNFNQSLGVQWGGKFSASAATGNPTNLAFPNSVGVTGGPSMGATASGSGNYFVNIPAPAGAGTGGGAIGFNFGSLTKALNLDLVLSALEATGEGKVISTPRVSALDNKEAKIEQGVSIPFATSQAGGATNVQFIDAKLSLVVTPHATPDNKIYLKIKASKNAPDTSLLGASGQPSIRKNEAETEILLADGDTAVIGGILILDRGQTVNQVPFFGDLPLIGWLFRSKTTREEKRELIIFITPRVIRQEAI